MKSRIIGSPCYPARKHRGKWKNLIYSYVVTPFVQCIANPLQCQNLKPIHCCSKLDGPRRKRAKYLSLTAASLTKQWSLRRRLMFFLTRKKTCPQVPRKPLERHWKKSSQSQKAIFFAHMGAPKPNYTLHSLRSVRRMWRRRIHKFGKPLVNGEVPSNQIRT